MTFLDWLVFGDNASKCISNFTETWTLVPSDWPLKFSAKFAKIGNAVLINKWELWINSEFLFLFMHKEAGMPTIFQTTQRRNDDNDVEKQKNCTTRSLLKMIL